MPPRHSPFLVGLIVALLLGAASFVAFRLINGGDSPGSTIAGSTSSSSEGDPGTGNGSTTDPGATISVPTVSITTTTAESPAPLHPWVDRRSVGKKWGEPAGLLMFRGNPTNTYYGEGPVPDTPQVAWRYPDSGPMCSQSTDLGTTSVWCGNGWTGQPVLWERPDGVTEMIFGAYDRALHFVDAVTGEDLRKPFLTGDIIKGTPTIDPDGYPLVYFGSRDNKMRVLALDRADPLELWFLEADLKVEGRWNDDFDANPRIINDILFEGAENGFFYIYKLNRGYDENGLVEVDPEFLFKMQTYDDELLAKIGPSYPAISVENTAAIFEGRAYFANSAGRVVGLDITDIENGNAPIVFDYWVGDDVDASIVVDREGFIYVSAEYERYLNRAKELGQLIKLDPYTDGDPYVWGMFSLTDPPGKGGLWSTPALGDGVLYAITNKGFLIAVDQQDGEEIWVDTVGFGTWTSPAIVDGKLIVATNGGTLRSYDLTDPRMPVLDWELPVGDAHIEATPAVYKGFIYIGSRDGYMYAITE